MYGSNRSLTILSLSVRFHVSIAGSSGSLGSGDVATRVQYVKTSLRACQLGNRTASVKVLQDICGMGSRPLRLGWRVEVEEGSKPRCAGVRRALRLVEMESSIWERERRRKSRRKRVLKQKMGVSVGRMGGSVMMRFWFLGVCRGREDGGEGDGEGLVVQNHASLVVGYRLMCSKVERYQEDLRRRALRVICVCFDHACVFQLA